MGGEETGEGEQGRGRLEQQVAREREIPSEATPARSGLPLTCVSCLPVGWGGSLVSVQCKRSGDVLARPASHWLPARCIAAKPSQPAGWLAGWLAARTVWARATSICHCSRARNHTKHTHTGGRLAKVEAPISRLRLKLELKSVQFSSILARPLAVPLPSALSSSPCRCHCPDQPTRRPSRPSGRLLKQAGRACHC